MPLYISSASLVWALKHIEKNGDTDIFPVPFEFEAIRHSWDKYFRSYFSKQDILQYQTRPYRRCLSPKHRFGFRISTQLDPIDTLIYTALVYDIGSDIESRRVPVKKQIVHSYRFKPNAKGQLFNPDIGYDTFIQKSKSLCSSGKYKYVVVADIADFFPRIYTHPLENALNVCTQKTDHATAIKKLINQWNFTKSYGIPIGQSVSGLLAELVIADVDDALLSEKKVYCRFSDDFRIFCRDKRSGYESLAYLANVLFEMHGLTLQQNKTHILTVEDFEKRYLETGSKKERSSLTEKFSEILEDMGIEDPYEEIDYDSLETEQQEEIDSLNLRGILEEQIGLGIDLNLNITGFILRRLSQINDLDGLSLVLKNIETLYPVFKDVLIYVTAIRKVDTKYRRKLGRFLIELIKNSVVGHLEFHKCWIINTFTKNKEWDNKNEFATIYNNNNDEFSRRESILALGRAGQDYWFKTKKRNVFQFGPWEKRAFLAAASCLPKDEAKHWYRSIYGPLDILEKSVVDWAKAYPFV
jgi:hypothetical protein